MANRVFLTDAGYIEMILEGNQTRESLFQTLQETLQYNNALSLQNKVIRTLLNLSHMISIDSAAEALSKLSLVSFDYDKLAVYGANDQNRDLVLNILKTAQDSSKVKYCDNRENAIAWLTAGST